MPVLSWLLVAGRNVPPGFPNGTPSKDIPRMHPDISPSRGTPRPPKRTGNLAQPVYGATTRFLPKPDWPNPQSQSFSRSYGSDLPTSLTYINLSTRGCSPRRPDADMGTNRREGTHSYPWVFKFHTGEARTLQEPQRSSGPRPSLRSTRFTRPSAP